MKNLTLKNIAASCGGTYIGDPQKADAHVTGVVTDSRKVQPGFLYIPFRGERVDGHSFIPAAVKEGAAAVLSEEEIEDPGVPYILVASCPQALKDIAGSYRSSLSLKIIGITGSVGKTSTKEMIASVLSEKYNVLKTEGNFNNEIGLPLTILRIRDEHEAAVVEMGISDFGEMHRLSKIARPDICVMTNIGQCHLENLGDRDGVLKAKSEIFDFLRPDGAVILNGNDDKLCTIKSARGVIPMRYYVYEGPCKEAKMPRGQYPVYADNIENKGLSGMEFDLHIQENTYRVLEPIPGLHNVYNACAAACAGLLLKMSDEKICAGIGKAKTIAGRTNVINSGGITVIDDCYNANPVSMKAALDVLSKAKGRKIAVLGDMGELGEDEEKLHAGVGEYAAASGIDMLFACGELSKETVQSAASGCRALHFDTADELMFALLPQLKSGDTVLVKASHFMGFSKIVESLTSRAR